MAFFTLQCGTWLWDDMLLNSQNIRHIGILLVFLDEKVQDDGYPPSWILGVQ